MGIESFCRSISNLSHQVYQKYREVEQKIEQNKPTILKVGTVALVSLAIAGTCYMAYIEHQGGKVPMLTQVTVYASWFEAYRFMGAAWPEPAW